MCTSVRCHLPVELERGKMEMERSFSASPPLVSCCWIPKKRSHGDQFGVSSPTRISPEKRRRLSSESPLSGSIRHVSGGLYLTSILPEELLLHIFSFLRESDLCQASLVCKKFARFASDRLKVSIECRELISEIENYGYGKDINCLLYTSPSPRDS